MCGIRILTDNIFVRLGEKRSIFLGLLLSVRVCGSADDARCKTTVNVGGA